MVEQIRSHTLPHIHTDGKRLLTKNLTPGNSVYGEELITHQGVEYRVWNPRRSKLAALILKGTNIFPFEEGSNVLYLGAATGTTCSHISDIVTNGLVYSVEISPWAFRKLIGLCEDRPNMVPILADANKPESYSRQVQHVDIIYQDIAQRDQVSTFLKNLKFLKKGGAGYLMLKARSIDVTAEPTTLYKKAIERFEGKGLLILEYLELEPYETDHACIIIQKRD